MQDRTFLLLAIRPNLNTLDKDLNTKEIETFQNDVLRPILKFQNDLLLQIFIDYVKQYKGVFFKLSNSLNTIFKILLISLFTSDEINILKQP